MAEIKHKIISEPHFLRDMAYTAHFDFKKFSDLFLLAEEVQIDFVQVINTNPNKPISNEIDVSKDGKVIKVKYITSQYHLENGRMSDPPSPTSFFKNFNFYFLNTVVKEDNERFNNAKSV